MTELAQSTGPRSPGVTDPSVASWMSDVSSISTSPALHTDDRGLTSAGEAVEHGLYFLKDGNIIFQVENTLFRVHQYFFARDSAHFRDLISARLNAISSGEGTTFSSAAPLFVRVVDEDVTSLDFERLLGVFYPNEYGKLSASSFDEWVSILHLSSKWGFDPIRVIAGREVLLVASPVDKIVLGRKYGMDTFLFGALVELCQRNESLTIEEGRRLGVDDVIRIDQVRQAIRISKEKITDSSTEVAIKKFFCDDPSVISGCACSPGERFTLPLSAQSSERNQSTPSMAGSEAALRIVPAVDEDSEVIRSIGDMFANLSYLSTVPQNRIKSNLVLPYIIRHIDSAGVLKGVVALLVNAGSYHRPTSHYRNADHEKFYTLCGNLSAMISPSITDDIDSNLAGGSLFRRYLVDRCLCIQGWDPVGSFYDGNHISLQRREGSVRFLSSSPIWKNVSDDLFRRGLPAMISQIGAEDAIEQIAVMRLLIDEVDYKPYYREMVSYVQQIGQLTRTMDWRAACKAEELSAHWGQKSRAY